MVQRGLAVACGGLAARAQQRSGPRGEAAGGGYTLCSRGGVGRAQEERAREKAREQGPGWLTAHQHHRIKGASSGGSPGCFVELMYSCAWGAVLAAAQGQVQQ
jgi:hypothetical protein